MNHIDVKNMAVKLYFLGVMKYCCYKISLLKNA